MTAWASTSLYGIDYIGSLVFLVGRAHRSHGAAESKFPTILSMKKLIQLIILACATSVFAATLTIDIPNVDVPRIQEAYGGIYNLGRPATQTDIENAVRQWLRDSTQDYERRKNMQQFTPPRSVFYAGAYADTDTGWIESGTGQGSDT